MSKGTYDPNQPRGSNGEWITAGISGEKFAAMKSELAGLKASPKSSLVKDLGRLDNSHAMSEPKGVIVNQLMQNKFGRTSMTAFSNKEVTGMHRAINKARK